MRIVPAVDIRGGLCVNLVQGDYARETVFSADPVAQAAQWHAGAAGVIHIVDLDGAREGRCCIEPQLRQMAQQGIPFEVGGGIRDIQTVRTLIQAGAHRIIIGTAAWRNPGFLKQAADEFPGRIIAGIDARNGKVAISGWYETTDADAIEFAQKMAGEGACRIIFTDVCSDGMMQGPNYETTAALARAVPIPVTASGGVSSLDNIRRLRELEPDGVDEVIVGRALYLNVFTLREAVEAAGGLS